MKNHTIVRTQIAVLGMALSIAAATDSLTQRQVELLRTLDSMEASVLGLGFNGEARSGFESSALTSDDSDPSAADREASAFTQMDLRLFARPTAESRARIDMRLHQDWQMAHEQGLNPVQVNWWSYDGFAIDRKLAFHIGDMRVGYTPLTMYTAQVNHLQEPKIFAEKRMQSMAHRNLDGSTDRLLQGLHTDFHSGEAFGIFSDIHAQGSLARLRNNAKKTDQVFYDFDREDRYMAAGRFGLEAYGVTLGINQVSSFDRVKSARTFKLLAGDTVLYDFNDVLSYGVSFDSRKISDGVLRYSAGIEMASSNWRSELDAGVEEIVSSPFIVQDVFVNSEGMLDTTAYVTYRTEKKVVATEHSKVDEIDGKAMLLNAQVAWGDPDMGASLDLRFINNDENFWSEMAGTPAFIGLRPILNSDAAFMSDLSLLQAVRSGSLENLYYNIYQSLPLAQNNMMGKGLVGVTPPESEYYRLFNNYEMAHYYRNGYTNATITRTEMISNGLTIIDPVAGLALPLGAATANRSGFDLSVDYIFGRAIEANVRYGSLKEVEGDNAFTNLGIGLGADLATTFGMAQALNVDVSYASESETKGNETKVDRIMAGVEAGVWGNISVLAGYQTIEKTFGLAWFGVKGSSESLVLAGPQVRLSAGSTLAVQYGLMTNTIDYTDALGAAQQLDIEKSLLTANIKVQF